MTCTPLVPRRLARHVLFQTHRIEEGQARWSSAAQPARIRLIEEPFQASVSRVVLPNGVFFYTQIQGTYSVRTMQLGQSYSLMLLTEGHGEWTWNPAGTPMLLRPGAVILTAPGVDISYTVSQPSGFTAKIGMDSIDRIRFLGLPYQRRAEISGLLCDADTVDVANLMLFLASEIERKPPKEGDAWSQHSTIMEALSKRSLMLLRQRLEPMESVSEGDIVTISQCDRAICEAQGRLRSMAQLSQDVPWSERQIYRAFSRICNCPPSDYMRRVAMIRARCMLEIIDPPVRHISIVATELGYGTLRSFLRDYRAEFGTEP